MDNPTLTPEEQALIAQAMGFVSEQPAPEQLPVKAKLTLTSPSSEETAEPQYPVPVPANDQYQAFIDRWKDPKNLKRKGVNVLGRKVKKTIADELMKRAVEALSDQFSIYQLPLIMARRDLSLDSFFSTLAQIRDNPEIAARDRMAANREIHQTLLTFLKAHTSPDNRPAYATQQAADKDKNILGVLVNVNAPLPTNPTASAEVKQLPILNASVEDAIYEQDAGEGPPLNSR